MPLATGSRLGPYEILAPLSAGGMGEVYRARDMRLKREVAVKVLPQEFATDPARRQRFEFEARTVATLNHPNIIAIYDVGTEDGAPYIITELIDGEPLRAGVFALRKSLDCAIQIANGLAAAHDAGVVHRDLKPENILLTRDGRIKILDFGLARMSVTRTAAAAAETLTIHTEPGVVLGTVGYMSPEQVRGKEADPRSDIFSFGVVLYELLSGGRAFQGETSVETMTAILKQQLPELPEAVPPGVREVVHHCLDKNPDSRFQSARDLSFALTAVSQSRVTSGGAPNLAGTPHRRRRGILMAAAAVGAMALVIAAFLLLVHPAPPTNWTGSLLGGPEVAFRPRPSPDGQLLAFYAIEDGYTQVGVMKPETGNWSMLTHSRGQGYVTNVAWAPDGSAIYYDRLTSVPKGIYSVPVLGGDEHLVFADAFRPEALPDGSLLAVKLNSNHEWQLFRFWPATGKVQDLPVAVVDAQESLANPRAFPDGKEAVVDGAPLGKEAGGMNLLVVDLATGATRPVAPGLPRGTGAPDFAVTRDGKSVLITREFGPFTRVFSVPVQGRGPAQTLFTATHEVWGVETASDGSIYACVTDVPAELVSRPLDHDETQTVARFPWVSDPDSIVVLPDGRVVMGEFYSGRSRLIVVERGKSPVAMASTTEETSIPATLAGQREIAFLIGPEPRGTIAFADIETGRITRRIAPGRGEIVSLAASHDGTTVYFAAGGVIWSIPSAGGEARKIRSGNRVVTDRSGRALLISILESPKMRLFRVPLNGESETEIPADPAHSVAYQLLSPGSWNPDGRLLVSLHDSWFSGPAVLDTSTGRVQPLPFDNGSDYSSLSWLPDGRILALRVSLRSTLWRFTASRE